MLKSTIIAIGLAAGFAGTANATMMPLVVATGDTMTMKVGERCGAGYWRAGPGNVCRPFNSPYGVARGTRYECPLGWHIGPEGGACWPNR